MVSRRGFLGKIAAIAGAAAVAPSMQAAEAAPTTMHNGGLVVQGSAELEGALNVRQAPLIVMRQGHGDLTIDARMYGVVGDGMADDTVALQNAIDVDAALGGGTVVTRGTVSVCRPLTIPDEVSLESWRPTSAWIRFT